MHRILRLFLLLWCASATVSCSDWKATGDQKGTQSPASMRRATVRAFDSGATPPVLTVHYKYLSPETNVSCDSL